MIKMKRSHRAVAKIAALSGVFGVALPALMPLNMAHAQGDVVAPTARQRRTPAEREAMRAKMEAARAERTETALRAALTRSGAADAATQNAVLDYAKSEMAARADSAKAKAKVMQALRTGAVTDSQFGVLLDEMRSAAEQEKTRRARSAAALDAKIGYTKKPRLEAVLVLTGLVGDEAATLSPMMPAMTGMGRGRGRRPANADGKTPRVRQPRKAAPAGGAPAAMPAP